MPKVTPFDRIVAELLRDEEFRKAVCYDVAAGETEAKAEAAIGSHLFKKLKTDEKKAIQEIACKDLTTKQLDDELKKVGRSYSYFVTDW